MPESRAARRMSRFEPVYGTVLLDLAHLVQTAAAKLDMPVQINHLPDPRVESEAHYYNAKHSKLIDLGLQPHMLSESLLDSLINIALKYRSRIDQALFLPTVNWRSPRNERRSRSYSMTGVSA